MVGESARQDKQDTEPAPSNTVRYLTCDFLFVPKVGSSAKRRKEEGEFDRSITLGLTACSD
jgi:hypothetical protein